MSLCHENGALGLVFSGKSKKLAGEILLNGEKALHLHVEIHFTQFVTTNNKLVPYKFVLQHSVN